MTSTALRRITALMALPLFLAPLSSAHAGQLTQGPGATTSVHATIDVHVAFPPTQDELDELDEVLQESARMICDVTEGGVLITDYNLASNGYSSAHADMYVYPPDWNNKAVVSPSGPFGFGRFLTAVFGQGPGVWGHEFAHLLLGLKDQYFDQDFNYGCGIGHGVDDVVDRHNNSILQSYTARCYDPTVMNNVAAYSSESCTNDQYCIDNVPGFPKCGATAPLTSELNVPANFESRLGDNNYPGPRQGEMLWLQANVGVNVPQDDWSETSRTIWFVEADGTEAWSYDIYIDARQTATGTYELQARLRDVQGSDKVVLDWQVDGTDVVPTLEVEFDSMAASCRGHASLRPADAVLVDGVPTGTDQVQLIIPASELNAPGATDIILDVTLDGELCMHTNDDAIYIYSATFPDPLPTNSAAAMGGAFVGAKYDANSDPEYLQIEQCDSYPGERFNSVTQLWEASNQWAKVRKEAAKRFANTPCDITKIGELGYCCDAQAGCKDSNHQCIYGACVDPDAVCDPDVDSQCGRHLLGTGSDWEYLRYNLEYNWQRSAPGFAKDLDLSFFMPQSTPNSDPRSPLTDCVAHTATVHHDFDAYDTVALVLDRSKSMDQDQGSRKRIEWAQRAILKWTDHVADGGSVQASLRKFNQDAPPAVFGFKTVLDAVVGGETATEIDSTAIEEYLEDIEPDGSTAIGDAIDAAVAALMAHDDLDPNSSNNNAIFLITDGEQTSGDKDVCDALEDAAKDDVPVYIAPVGSFKEDGFACVEGTGGKLLGAVLDHEIPGALFEMHTDYEGQALSLAYERSAVSGPMGGYPSDRSYTLRVEPNAEALSFLITPDSTYFNTWDLEFTLSGPLGESITEIDASYVTVDPNGYSISVRVPNPSAGDWEMKLSAPNMPSKLEPEVQTLMARVEHPGPRCDARVAQPLIESSTDAVEITAGAVWDYPLAEGVTYTATVRDPAGTTSTVPLTVDEDGLARGSFDGYSTDGIYLVRVNCDVADDAKHAYGEDADGRLTETTTVDSGFERVQTVAFTVDAGLYPDPIGDCDDNGVSDSLEGLGDMDGDGVPDYCDPDTDGDEIPDSVEGLLDRDSDGVLDFLDVDADDDGEHDSVDDDWEDALSGVRYAEGDLNGDGLVDRVWGEPEYDSGRGRVVVDYGGVGADSSYGLDTPGINGVAAVDDHFGATVTIGDFDGDGYDDLGVGTPDSDYSGLTEAGTINVIYGSSTGLTTLGDQYLSSDSPGINGVAETSERFGLRLSHGDFNCDGYDDLVIGVPDESVGSTVDAGAVHVIYGSAGGLSTVNDLWYQGNSGVNGSSEAGDRFGETVAAGDFDGDSCDDLVIGAPTENWGSTVDAGNAYAMYGGATGLSTTGDWTVIQGVILGAIGVDEFFATRLWAEDRNGDGYDDLLVMTPGDPCGAGEKGFNEVFGSASGLSATGSTWTCEVHRD